MLHREMIFVVYSCARGSLSATENFNAVVSLGTRLCLLSSLQKSFFEVAPYNCKLSGIRKVVKLVASNLKFKYRRYSVYGHPYNVFVTVVVIVQELNDHIETSAGNEHLQRSACLTHLLNEPSDLEPHRLWVGPLCKAKDSGKSAHKAKVLLNFSIVFNELWTISGRTIER